MSTGLAGPVRDNHSPLAWARHRHRNCNIVQTMKTSKLQNIYKFPYGLVYTVTPVSRHAEVAECIELRLQGLGTESED